MQRTVYASALGVAGDECAKVLGYDGEIGQQLADSMRASADLQVLGFGEIGFRNITNNVRRWSPRRICRA